MRRVRLPGHLYWSEPFDRSFDLDDRRDLARLYEIVMQQGSATDVREWVDPEEVARLWEALLLPPPVRDAWRLYLTRVRGCSLPSSAT